MKNVSASQIILCQTKWNELFDSEQELIDIMMTNERIKMGAAV